MAYIGILVTRCTLYTDMYKSDSIEKAFDWHTEIIILIVILHQ